MPLKVPEICFSCCFLIDCACITIFLEGHEIYQHKNNKMQERFRYLTSCS